MQVQDSYVIRRALKVVCGDVRKYPGLRISLKHKISDSKARFQIPFGIPSELYEIPAGVGPLENIKLMFACHKNRGMLSLSGCSYCLAKGERGVGNTGLLSSFLEFH